MHLEHSNGARRNSVDASPTSWHDEARAMKAADPSLSNREIGEHFGKTNSAVWKALHPERTKEWVQRDNARPERMVAKNQWMRQYLRREDVRGRCTECGGLLGIGSAREDSQVCQGCISAGADARRRDIQRLWAEGKSMRDICEELDMTEGWLCSEMSRMRELGWDLPYRYTAERRERMGASRWAR